jgi:TRAP-type C4-dicarboxylate transport system permease small subunit
MNIGYIAYRCFDNLRNIMIVVFFSIIIVSCFVEVWLRYAPWLRSMGWTEEVLRYLNVWIIFLGASVATKLKSHLVMEYFVQFFRQNYRIWITKVVYIMILVFLAILIVLGVQKTIKNIPQEVQAFPISIAWFYLAIPVGCFYMFIDFLLILIYGNHPFVRTEEEN